MKALAAALVLLALPVPVSAVQAATLTIHVAKIDKKGGTLRLSLYDEFGWSTVDDTPVVSANVPAIPPETTVVLRDIKPGVYAVKTFQDANNNGRFDQNFIGLPLEHYGFSHDARPFLSAPSFDRACFTLADGDNEITIHLQ